VAAQAGETAALGSMLPWSYADAEATRELMDADFWPYGIPDNQHVLRTFLGYLHDKQLTGRRWESASCSPRDPRRVPGVRTRCHPG
jgi:hypothetical protein